ncbi:glucosamine-6-phosphate deaminase [Salmonella enterica]|nr:glucosamine-6-phosphate deaminase [Salmonella enterica]
MLSAKECRKTCRKPISDAPRDKCAHFREINGIAAAFHYLQKNYNPTVSFFL